MTAELKAGVFVLAAIAALVYMTTKLTQNRFSFHGTKKYHSEVADATGLLMQSKVKMAGLDVGQLEDLQLVGKRAKITMQIAADIKIHQDAYISVKSIGFLGDKYIELYPGSDGSPVMEEGSVLPEKFQGGGIDQLTANTAEVLNNIKDITQVLKEALQGAGKGPGDSRLDRILDNMEEFSEGLASLDRIGDLAERLAESAENVRDITEKVKRGEGTIGKLLSDSQTIDHINSTLSGVNKFVNRANRLKVILDAHAGYLQTRSTSKSTASLILQPTWDKYYLVGVTASPRGVTGVKTTTTTTNPGATTQTSTVTKEEETDESTVGINAQFAKRFSDFVFRVGLFETTGGLGLDYHFLRDQGLLYSEIYRFRKGHQPQLNVGGQFKVFRPFYIRAGGEDIINKQHRSFFMAAGVRFNDQDIKSLVATAL